MLESNKSNFILNGRPFYVYSGEIHYFRIDRIKWKIHLKRAKEAGLNTVSTYIPWLWHEYQEGKFDFKGLTHAQRNLTGYMEEVMNSGLYLSVRIGPFSNAELKSEGLPGWLIENYPEVYSAGRGIVNLPHKTLVSYINPVFRDFIRKWYDKVITHIAPLQISNGGNIISTQLCNEIGMSQWVNSRGDYSNEATCMYQNYLKEKYRRIAKLREVYPGSKFSSFRKIKQPSNRSKHGWQDCWDWADFYRHYFADYYEYLYGLAAERGIDTPVIANIPQFIDFDVRGRGLASPMTTSFYKYIPEKISNIVFGCAYQMRRMDYENFHDVCITTQVVKALTEYSCPVVCSELQTGIMRDKPRLYASDVELNLKTSLASGVDGVNCYMFSGGKNPENIGMFGEMHQWQAPVSGDGITDEKFEVIREHGEFQKTFGEAIAETRPFFQTTVGIYTPYYGTEFLSSADCGLLVNARDRYFFDGIGRLLNLGSISFDIIDLAKSTLVPEKLKTLLVFAHFFMEKCIQEKLVKYVSDGGKLLIFPELPEKDLAGRRCSKLMEEFGLKVIKKIYPATVNVYKTECFVDGPVSVVEAAGKYKPVATVRNGICALSKKYGRGKFVFLGYPMPHYYDYQLDILNKIIRNELGVKRSINVAPTDIVAMIRTGKAGTFLFLMNYHQKKYNRVDIDIDVPEHKIALHEKNIHLDYRSGKILPINVRVNDKIKIIFSTAEVLAVKSTDSKKKPVKLKVKGCRGESIKVLLDIDGKKAEAAVVLKNKVEEISAVVK